MNATTLRGVFPEPKPIHKRNFVKENVVRIKQIQGVLQNSDENLIQKVRNRKLQPKKSVSHSSEHVIRARSRPSPKSLTSPRKKPGSINKQAKHDMSVPEGPIFSDRIAHRAVQTDRPEDICGLYANGTIMYPSARVLKNAKKEGVKKHGRGDTDSIRDGIVVSNPHNDDLIDDLQNLDLGDKHNFIKENILALKSRTKCNSPTVSPKNHRRGVVPKYIIERKEEHKRQQEVDTECPPDHVLLPEEERKETLRVLRQSYADRIKELNNMPVSNDTLKRRHRKMAIEEELKKIEEGIKVFQRPKVFVKINA